MRLTRFVFPFCLLSTACAAFAADDSTPVAIAATPLAVQQAIRTRIANGSLEEIDRNHDGDDITFDVSYTAKNGQEQGFTVAQDGTLLSVEVEMADLPAAVQQTMSSQARGWTLEGIDKNLDDTEVSYDIEVSKDGGDRTFTVADNGDLLSAEVNLADTPAAVQATVKAQVGGGSLGSIDENFDPAGNSYDVEMVTKAGGRSAFTVGVGGVVLSQEVVLGQIPAPVLKTIQTEISGGTILRIDKSLVEKEGKVLPYEVEARKDGKEFDFSVGPKGRFLGLDE